MHSCMRELNACSCSEESAGSICRFLMKLPLLTDSLTVAYSCKCYYHAGIVLTLQQRVHTVRSLTFPNKNRQFIATPCVKYFCPMYKDLYWIPRTMVNKLNSGNSLLRIASIIPCGTERTHNVFWYLRDVPW